MRLSSFNLAGMLLTLAAGIALGASIFREVPKTIAAADPPMPEPIAASTPATVAKDSGPQDAAPSIARDPDEAGYLGVTFARQSADVAARSDGTLQAVLVNLGDRIKAGDVIATTDSYSNEQQLETVEATLRSARADQQDAELELKDAKERHRRRAELALYGLISQEDLTTARLQVERAESKVMVARARVEEQTARVNDAKRSLANTTIRASFDGTVAARYLDAGAAVRFGTPIISLMRAEDLWVRFAIPESMAAKIGSSIRFELDGSAPSVPGVIEYVSPSISASSQEMLVEARLKIPAAMQAEIRPGRSGVVSLRKR
jgi:RND family efflux transporter MFP subunit